MAIASTCVATMCKLATNCAGAPKDCVLQCEAHSVKMCLLRCLGMLPVSPGVRSRLRTFGIRGIQFVVVVSITQLADMLVGLVDELHPGGRVFRRVAVGVPGSNKPSPCGLDLRITGTWVQAQFLVSLLVIHKGSFLSLHYWGTPLQALTSLVSPWAKLVIPP